MKLDEDTVRRIRERRGLTLAMVAAMAGTSKNTVLSAEHGGDIRPTTARKIAEALGVEITDLLGETEGPLAEAPPSQPSFENHLRAEERRDPTLADFQAVGAINDWCDRLEKVLETPDVGPTEVQVALYIVELVGKLLPALQEKDAIGPILRPVGARFIRLARRLVERWEQSGVEIPESIGEVIDAAERFDQQAG